MEPSEDSPLSLWMVRAAELFPKLSLEKDDDELNVPFNELAGESVKFLGRWENGVLATSNYRLFIQHSTKQSEVSIPIRLIETVQIKDIFQLIIGCRDAVTYSCTFSTSEACLEWYNRISPVTGVPETLEQLFAFPFHAWVSESAGSLEQEWYNRLQHAPDYDEDFRKDVDRLKFDLKGAWRVSTINIDFKLCPSYPKRVIVPACISDETLTEVAKFRSSRRIPAVTWRHSSGAVIARASQPEVGLLGWRSPKDEQLLKALTDACSFDNGKTKPDGEDFDTSSLETSQAEKINMDRPKKVLIVDARSYTSAVTNRARGGGVECTEYYPSSEIQFMNLGNIHVIRKSFNAIRMLSASPPDSLNWYSMLEKTLWLQHLGGLLAASHIVCHAIERNNRPILVHCSDGWDRTPQICATAQLCLDPFYRTVEGFRILVEKEWLSFGHKFGDRCGHGVGSEASDERCPAFIQWIDCVHQIHRQFPCSFEFSQSYLVKLVQHVHSCLFGTFLCNTMKERIENSVQDRTFSVWPFLSAAIYKNPLYQPNREKVLWPAHNVRDLRFWADVYLGSLNNLQNTDEAANIDDTRNTVEVSMTKTRSFDDLLKEMKNRETPRRLSDPSVITGEANLTIPLNIFHEDGDDSSEQANDDNLVNQNDVDGNGYTVNGDSNEVDEVDSKDSTLENGEPNLLNTSNKIDESSDTIVPENDEERHLSTNEAASDQSSPEVTAESTPTCSQQLNEGPQMNGTSQTNGQTNGNSQTNELSQTNGHRHHVPLTKCHLQRFDSRKSESYKDEQLKNGFTHYESNGHSSCRKEVKESISTDSRMSTPGIHTTPQTPPTYFLDRTSTNSTLPDGLNHALSQENIRLHQIVNEHKLKEEALQRELHYMRLALLKNNTCQCNSSKDKSVPSNLSEEMHPVIDCNSENSNCSWEAIDEKNPAFPTLWVPDHAITRCQSCQIEFWLGRRKHHCRCCGQIFCGDCSHFFAPIPQESFLEPVRLCESCYQNNHA